MNQFLDIAEEAYSGLETFSRLVFSATSPGSSAHVRWSRAIWAYRHSAAERESRCCCWPEF